MALSDDVKRETRLADLVAETCEMDRGSSSPHRGQFFFRCPFHAGGSRATLQVTEEPGSPGWFYCYGCAAGRGQDGAGSVIDWIMRRDGAGFAAAVEYLAARAGIGRRKPDPGAAEAALARAEAMAREAEARAEAEALDTRSRVLAIWHRAMDADTRRVTVGADRLVSCLAAYLSARTGGLITTPPPTLRVDTLCCYGGTDDAGDPLLLHRGPAMVAAVGRSRLVGVHRTWITPTGRALTEDGEKVPKQMLGPCYGAPVLLTPRDRESLLIVGEGIETTAAVLGALRANRRRAMEALGLPGMWMTRAISAEAALTLGALAGPADPAGRGPGLAANGAPLPSEIPAEDRPPGWLPDPQHVGPVLILADPSAKCPASAERHATRALNKLKSHGFDAFLSVPLGRFDHAADFADLAANGDLA